MPFILGKTYTRDEIYDETGGGSKQAYLPNKGGQILCACLNRRENPSAPYKILAGRGPEIERSGIILCEQKEPIPVFVKQEVNAWEYVGMFTVDRWTNHRADIDQYNRMSGRTDITRIIFLREVK